jgi:hypothetical protein
VEEFGVRANLDDESGLAGKGKGGLVGDDAIASSDEQQGRHTQFFACRRMRAWARRVAMNHPAVATWWTSGSLSKPASTSGLRETFSAVSPLGMVNVGKTRAATLAAASLGAETFIFNFNQGAASTSRLGFSLWPDSEQRPARWRRPGCGQARPMAFQRLAAWPSRRPWPDLRRSRQNPRCGRGARSERP